MAKLFDVNNTAFGDFTVTMYTFKEHLKLAGWTVPSSSDGTTYNASGDQITSASALANASAWYRIQDPAGVREFTVQHSSTASADEDYRIKYSRAAKFTGGSPGATQTPSATDEGIFFGGGTDASPTFADVFQAGQEANYIIHFMADNASPYNFYMIGYRTGSGVASIIALDSALSGSAAGDADPYCIWARHSGSNNILADGLPNGATITTCPTWAWVKPGIGGEQFSQQRSFEYANSAGGTGSPGAFSVNPNNGNDTPLLVLLGRYTSDSAPNGPKMYSSLVYMNSQGRSNGDTLNLTGTKSHAVFGMFVVDWDGTSTPQV